MKISIKSTASALLILGICLFLCLSFSQAQDEPLQVSFSSPLLNWDFVNKNTSISDIVPVCLHFAEMLEKSGINAGYALRLNNTISGPWEFDFYIFISASGKEEDTAVFINSSMSGLIKILSESDSPGMLIKHRHDEAFSLISNADSISSCSNANICILPPTDLVLLHYSGERPLILRIRPVWLLGDFYHIPENSLGTEGLAWDSLFFNSGSLPASIKNRTEDSLIIFLEQRVNRLNNEIKHNRVFSAFNIYFEIISLLGEGIDDNMDYEYHLKQLEYSYLYSYPKALLEIISDYPDIKSYFTSSNARIHTQKALNQSASLISHPDRIRIGSIRMYVDYYLGRFKSSDYSPDRLRKNALSLAHFTGILSLHLYRPLDIHEKTGHLMELLAKRNIIPLFADDSGNILSAVHIEGIEGLEIMSMARIMSRLKYRKIKNIRLHSLKDKG